ncbi:MAG: DUF438 domain-containing protein [Candidatus Bathyarchaeia archaeon]
MKETIKNLDLRNTLPPERHAKILEMWNNLKEGEALRVINDHDPKPLYYQFEVEHKGRFKWEYEQSRPKEWIVKIKKVTKEKDNKEDMKELLKQLHSGINVNKIKEKGKEFLKSLSPTDLALLEQEIIQEGVTREEMRKLCDVHLEIVKDSLKRVDIEVNPGHPIHTLMEEHKAILDFIDKLQNIINSIGSAKDFSDVVEEVKTLRHISEHLIEADKHHKREEEVLFPELEKFGVIEPPEIMRDEHRDLKAKKAALNKIASENSELKYSEFVKKVKEIGEYLIKELPNHIYKEDNILYPMALQVIPNNRWGHMKEECDKIGYCCFTPLQQN